MSDSDLDTENYAALEEDLAALIAEVRASIADLKTVPRSLPAGMRSVGRTPEITLQFVINMTQNNNYGGQVGAQGGDNTRADHNTFTQLLPGQAVDLQAFAEELKTVRLAMKQQAHPEDLDQDEEIGNIAQAEKAARAGDERTLISHMGSVGKFTLDVAKSTIAGLVVAVIKAQTGMS